MIGYEIYNYLQPAAMRTLHQIFKFLHTFGNIFRQIRVYIIIVLYGVGRTGLTLYDSRMIGLDIIATVIRLRCVFNDTCIPNVGSTQFFDFS